MTSIVWDIALQVEWMGSTEYWDNNMEEGTDYSYLECEVVIVSSMKLSKLTPRPCLRDFLDLWQHEKILGIVIQITYTAYLDLIKMTFS